MHTSEGNQETIEQTLWIFETTPAASSSGTLHLFYAPDEQTAYGHTGDVLKQAAKRGESLKFRRLSAYPYGFRTGNTAWLGKVHVRPDGSLREGAARQPIERVAYKGGVEEDV